jgi:hypothetical protein
MIEEYQRRLNLRYMPPGSSQRDVKCILMETLLEQVVVLERVGIELGFGGHRQEDLAVRNG